MFTSINVLGGPLVPCSHKPKTGWYRDGCCNTNEQDFGSHTVCVSLTDEILEFLKENGNDLITPHPEHGFAGLKKGDSWCVCALSWRDAHRAGMSAPVKLESTHRAALNIVSLEDLMQHSVATEV